MCTGIMPVHIFFIGGDEMTLEEYFEKVVLPVLGENPDAADGYDEENIVGVFNAVAVECLDINNRMFRKDSKEELPYSWYEVSDELPFDERLLNECMCYGMAARLIIDDADTDSNKIGFLESCYQTAKEKYLKKWAAKIVIWSENQEGGAFNV